MKRRKKSTAAPNPKKMFEESQMVRRVKAYLNNLQVVTDESKLHEMSLECESASGGSTSVPSIIPGPKRHASPAPSTTSSTSSASDERKPITKFGKPVSQSFTLSFSTFVALKGTVSSIYLISLHYFIYFFLMFYAQIIAHNLFYLFLNRLIVSSNGDSIDL